MDGVSLYLVHTGRKRNLAPREREIKVLTKGDVAAMEGKGMVADMEGERERERESVCVCRAGSNAKTLFIEEDSPIKGNLARASRTTWIAKLSLLSFNTSVYLRLKPNTSG